jgi:hypothetical protein
MDCAVNELVGKDSVEATSVEEGPVSNLVHVNGYADLDLPVYGSAF